MQDLLLEMRSVEKHTFAMRQSESDNFGLPDKDSTTHD